MKNSLIALAVTVSLTAGAVYAATTSYSDVSGNWAQSDINSVVEKDIMTGFNDGNFHPDAWVTRAEFTTMAGRTLGLTSDKVDNVPSLQKVNNNHWNFSNVEDQSWISSYPSGVFRPSNPIRRAEALSALSGTLNKPLVSDAEATQILSKYSDANQVPANVRREVATAIQYNMFAVDPKYGATQIDPMRPATRAEVASMLNDLYQNRDIAIVQNGEVVASGTSTDTSVYSTASAEEGTAATGASASAVAANQQIADSSTGSTTSDVNTYGQSMEDENTDNGQTTGTSAARMGSDEENDNDKEPTKIGYKKMEAGEWNWVVDGSIPYRSSADTIELYRSVNTTKTPTNLSEDQANNIPMNTTFTGTVAKALYSEYNRPGDPIMLILDHPLYGTNGKIVAPAGSKVVGVVSDVVSYNRSNENAQLRLTFNGIVTPEGQIIPIHATVANSDGVLKAGEDNTVGVIYNPTRSTAALAREINASEGGLYGIKQGKQGVLDEPLVSQVSAQPIDPMDRTIKNLVIGVGDRLQLRVEQEDETTTQ